MEELDKKEPLHCAACLNNIGHCDYVSAQEKDWHKDCFRCSVCDVQLSSWYFEKGGLLFCQTDYWEQFGETCQKCQQVMTGPVMSAGQHQFHPECFRCQACCGHVGDGEPYALVDRTQLYCGNCYNASGRPLSQAGSSHAIRVLHLPPTKLRLQPDKDNYIVTQCHLGGELCRVTRALLRAALSLCPHLTCQRIESACGVLSLQLGDRILELEGAAVAHHSPAELETIIAAADTTVQLTVEQNSESPKVISDNSQAETDKTHSTCDSEPAAGGARGGESEVGAGGVGGGGARRERLFKRREGGGGAAEGARGRAVRRRQPVPASPQLGEKERSSSMSKLLDVVEGGESQGGAGRAGRSRSFRACDATLPASRVFRASDLVQGELLGCGFFGEVYKVVQRDSGEEMVLKQLYRLDAGAQDNFLKEVAVLRSLQHQNVLRFIGVLYRDKRLHLVTEYVPGGTLHHLLQDRSVELPWRLRGRLARDVAAGVGYLHRMNVIHRDLNSHNCLVREDKSVVVADFGLARVVRGTASSERLARHPHRRRYTVVGNPYWMAPEMMNGDVYDEKVDVFSFGIMLCEIIGRVSADPDFLPRRSDFGLNEEQFQQQFCSGAPSSLVAVAFLACHLDPDHRPPFEVMEIWLESLIMHLSDGGLVEGTLLADIQQYSRRSHPRGHSSPGPGDRPYCHQNSGCDQCQCQMDGGLLADVCQCCSVMKHATSVVGSMELTGGVLKSQSITLVGEEGDTGRALGKCVSAGHIAAPRPGGPPSLSRSALSLAPGYLLHACGNNINITKVDDIAKYLDPPPPLKRSSPDAQINRIAEAQETKARRLDQPDHSKLPCYLRNQSDEGLETSSDKHDELLSLLPLCRHDSVPADSDSSDDDLPDSKWYRNVTAFRKINKMDVDQPKSKKSSIVKKGEHLLSKKSSYDITDSVKDDCVNVKRTERKHNEIKTKSPVVTSVKTTKVEPKSDKKENYFTKKLLSPKLSRLFRPAEDRKPEEKQDKSKSKFFIQRPASPASVCRSTYRIRPSDDKLDKMKENVIKSDLKLASLGKPMTPIFQRHLGSEAGSQPGRFSYRDKRYKCDNNPQPRYDVIRRVTPLPRSPPAVNLPALVEKPPPTSGGKLRNKGISKSNYVNLANLKINSTNEFEANLKTKPSLVRTDHVI